jgi:Cu2+-exporting ATPase
MRENVDYAHRQPRQAAAQVAADRKAHGKPGAMHAHIVGHVHNAAMATDLRRRFWLSLLLTPPVLFLSPLIQHELGLGDALRFRGDGLVLIALSSMIYVYGGWPFPTGFLAELRHRRPSMMTLVAVAISAANFIP